MKAKSNKQIDTLLSHLREQIEYAKINVERPRRPDGVWIVDVRVEDRLFVVELKPGVGFGISLVTDDSGYGERPDEMYLDASTAADRLAELVRTGGDTEPMRQRFLQELRQLAELSQVELAERLGMKQPTLSKLEARDTVSLDALHRVTQALGGHLQVKVEIGGRTFELPTDRIVRGSEPPPTR